MVTDTPPNQMDMDRHYQAQAIIRSTSKGPNILSTSIGPLNTKCREKPKASSNQLLDSIDDNTNKENNTHSSTQNISRPSTSGIDPGRNFIKCLLLSKCTYQIQLDT